MRLTLILIVVAVLGLLAGLAGNTFRQESRQPAVAPPPEIEIDAQAAAERLAEAIRIPTVSHQDPAAFDGAPFLALHDLLARTFPRAHAALARETVNRYSLLYTWPGSAAHRKPVLLTAHLDVVPVEPGSEERWSRSAFAGDVADGFIWGRGALDDKVSALAMLEAVELLLDEGFAPRRTVHLAFGHDEEVGGAQGAARVAALLAERGTRLHFTLDEGLVVTHGLMPGVAAPVALIGLAEKGYVSLELSAQSAGGHSSMPPPHSAAGLVAGAVHALEDNRMPARIAGPVAEMFDYVGPEAAVPLRFVFTNLWLLAPVVEWQLSGTPSTNALIRTTTATTMLQAGVKENVLPSSARAVVNFRILPGDSIAGVVDHVRRTVDDPAIEIRQLPGNEPSPVADSGSDSFRALLRAVRQVFPDAVVAPGLFIAGSDSRHYVGLSDNSYRFLPLRLGPDDLARIHGIDERIAVDNYAEIIRFYVQVIRNAAS